MGSSARMTCFRGGFGEAPVAVEQHVEIRTDRFARRKRALDAARDRFLHVRLVDLVRHDAIERRNLDRGEALGLHRPSDLEIAFDRAIRNAAVHVRIHAYFVAQLLAEERVHGLARCLAADVHDGHLERAVDRIHREPAERMRIHRQYGQRLLERLSDELALNAPEARQLDVFPALKGRFAQPRDPLVGRNAEERPVGFLRDVHEQRFYFCDFHWGVRRLRGARAPSSLDASRYFARANRRGTHDTRFQKSDGRIRTAHRRDSPQYARAASRYCLFPRR